MQIPAIAQRNGFPLFVVIGTLVASLAAESVLAQPPANKPPLPAPAPLAPDPFVVPDGTPAELVEYLQKLQTLQPPPMDPNSLMDFRRKLLGAMLEASEKILSQKATEEQTQTAVYAKVGALVVLDRLGEKGAAERLAKLPAELQAAGMKQAAREVEAFLFESRLRRARTLKREELAALVGEVKKFLTGVPLQEIDASLAMATANVAEMTGDQKMATEAYRDLGKLLLASENKDVARIGAMMQGAARRLNLVGQPIEMAGTSLDGEKLDWEKYRGKVVLVDFWATWCGPCLAELPSILKSYEVYHDRGFEVIGVSIDNDREQLKAFLDDRKLPWPVLYDAALGEKSLARHYGVFAIPAMMLVGRDGKVIATEVRGPQLEEELARLLGPAEKPKAPAAVE